MCIYLKRRGNHYSPTTIPQYMNRQLRLCFVVHPKKSGCQTGKPHKVFANLLAQNFCVAGPNQRWCTDFTYLFLKGVEVRYTSVTKKLDYYNSAYITRQAF